jgi:hypothetical protein
LFTNTLLQLVPKRHFLRRRGAVGSPLKERRTPPKEGDLAHREDTRRFSLSSLENHTYTVTRGICWEIRDAHAKMRGAKQLSYLENHTYTVTRGICWETRG